MALFPVIFLNIVTSSGMGKSVPAFEKDFRKSKNILFQRHVGKSDTL